MAIQDKAVTVKGNQTVLASVSMYPNADGSVTVVAVGSTKDAGGAIVPLSEARLVASGVAVIDNLMARALTELRKANGLEV